MLFLTGCEKMAVTTLKECYHWYSHFHYDLKQLIAELTHILPSSSSCIDLIFTNQPNKVGSSGVFTSIYQSCHHQIVFTKVNPPPYTWRVLNHSNADHEAINNAIDNLDWEIGNLDWEKAFSNVNVHTQVKFFNESRSYIFMNIVPNKN